VATTTVLLSICIPNLNQGTALLCSIRNLDLLSTFPEVEILISDNGSDEFESDSALNYARNVLPRVKIFTGATTVKLHEGQTSFGANLERLSKNANGTYVWFLGSGDLILNQYVDELLAILRLDQFDNIVLKARNYQGSGRESAVQESLKRVAPSDALSVGNQSSYPFFDHSISCNITRREVLMSMDQEFSEVASDRYICQNYWPHVERYLRYMSTCASFNSCNLNPEIVLVDQPTDGWFSKPSAMDVYFSLGSLYDDYAAQSLRIHGLFFSELFRNRILRVVSLVLQIRILTGDSFTIDKNLMRKLSARLPIFKLLYLRASLSCYKILLRPFRRVNYWLVKKLTQ
jgi:hypothetical protein